ncbi:hypothetical protein A4X13_0g1017 [Tilletia indica]|uniref:Uncharacterized protein n=1 Tax=Tilletia indica TaxID=43049 RepID=A0A177TTC0_9BASI|nr:hypothetical protein A4X13_0g1017 [Tilletia indica]
MFAFVKNHGQKLALLLLASQLATTAVLASPSEFDLETPTDFLLARAIRGSGYVSATCKTNATCYSANCVTASDGVKKTCQRQPPGGPCFENGNCNTRQCDLTSGTCKQSALLGVCTVGTDCAPYDPQNIFFGDNTVTCQDKKCKSIRQGSCTQNKQCTTGFCSANVCRLPPQGVSCQDDAECGSGTCFNFGALSSLPYQYDYRCTRYSPGHTCVNNSECLGSCMKGKCVASTDGDSCTSIFECTSPAICGSDNKCITPGNNTLVPNKICAADSQCTSHRCVGDQYQQDANGAIVSIRYGRYPERCDYFDNGESGCSTFYDCKGGFCKNGTCGPGKDGDRCQFTSHCVNLCSTTGYCFTPTRRQNRGAPCLYDSNCISKYCIYGNITRNRLSDGAPTLLPDLVCGPSFEGRPCGVDTDCDRGSCPTGTKICTVQPLGATCNFDSECNTSYCQKSSSGSGSGTCALAPYYTTCNSDDTCYSKDCGELPDPDPQPCLHDYYGEGCPYYGCLAVPSGGTCRITKDCDTATQVCTNSKCVTK